MGRAGILARSYPVCALLSILNSEAPAAKGRPRSGRPNAEMTRTKTACLLLAVGAALPLGGCLGGDDKSDRDQIDQVMSDLQSASRDGDGSRICQEIFTPKLAALISRSAKSGNCATEVKAKLFSPDAKIDVASVEVPDGSNATATVKEANGNLSKVYLVKQGGDWRIRRVTPA
jgi:hypothetical protein